ncbi:threonine/homoserine efflux transporter RhtA [Mesocricetibacter intestinalis]|uniref:Threonine/homoserine efflux transporter RhtA n=1 Tax=Mesocricetibacter intestinalis TaxID=1521930 RepID=A0A4R6VBP4_9PAST|nr:EamA family transporter [Mesocricetibacter intestinalis]TDQ59637.1 threonine/homoserine efflux transporter RhtA [Mesocricetibacter intestinalis]
MIYQLIAVFIWASAFIAGKYTYEIMDPVLMVQLRLMIPALIILPLFFKAYRRIQPHLRKKVWLLALLNFPLAFILQFTGLYYTSAASAVTMIGMEPLIVVMVGYFFFRQRVRPHDWLLSLIAFLGIGLTVFGAEENGNISLLGCMLVLASGIVFAFCIYLGKQVMKEINPALYTNVIIVLGSLLCIPFSLLLVRDWNITPTVKGISALFYLGIGCSWVAVWLWNMGLQNTSANVSSIINTLEPVFGVFLAIILLGDSLSFITAIGILCVIGATMLSVLSPFLKKHTYRRKTG